MLFILQQMSIGNSANAYYTKRNRKNLIHSNKKNIHGLKKDNAIQPIKMQKKKKEKKRKREKNQTKPLHGIASLSPARPKTISTQRVSFSHGASPASPHSLRILLCT
jgi:hypothetical protein